MEFLNDTNIVVSIAFVAFVLVLLYLKVPGRIGGLLDQRAEGIRRDLDEARSLRDEAKALLDSFAAKQKEAESQAEHIRATAEAEARAAAEAAKAELEAGIARRIQSAKDQIASAEAAAMRQIRERAAGAAIEAARSVIAANISAADSDRLVDAAIAEAGKKLH
jgi:F-type H+-transporting ATPase subunit b